MEELITKIAQAAYAECDRICDDDSPDENNTRSWTVVNLAATILDLHGLCYGQKDIEWMD